jgi:hypothetical protein
VDPGFPVSALLLLPQAATPNASAAAAGATASHWRDLTGAPSFRLRCRG